MTLAEAQQAIDDEMADRTLTEAYTRMVDGLGKVLDVEAGLADIINRSNDNKEQ